jgi:hypothetical protein
MFWCLPQRRSNIFLKTNEWILPLSEVLTHYEKSTGLFCTSTSLRIDKHSETPKHNVRQTRTELVNSTDSDGPLLDWILVSLRLGFRRLTAVYDSNHSLSPGSYSLGPMLICMLIWSPAACIPIIVSRIWIIRSWLVSCAAANLIGRSRRWWSTHQTEIPSRHDPKISDYRHQIFHRLEADPFMNATSTSDPYTRSQTNELTPDPFQYVYSNLFDSWPLPVNAIHPASSSQHVMFGKCHRWTCANFWRVLRAFLHNTVSTLIPRL